MPKAFAMCAGQEDEEKHLRFDFVFSTKSKKTERIPGKKMTLAVVVTTMTYVQDSLLV